ncbi:pilus assembly protein TadG-related protein [Demequina sp. NBRC 110056]|uniref:pilus assembly protein TadG-related protein n=1 Tax=Demequina sp. NBRC 110056 TaxID=1570345 RepID=UPI0011815697|nr:pilus assembly protein TadG-related protein [Demequina sp. NBRC 110056]
MRARCTRRPPAGDAGSVSLFTLGWIVVALLAIAVLVGATQVHLARTRLVNLADELAIAALNDTLRDAYESAEAGDVGLTLDDRALASAVAERLASADARDWIREVRVVEVGSEDDATVEVVLRRTVLPLVPDADWLSGAGVTVTATGSARAS